MADSQRKTANLWGEIYPDISSTVQYVPLYVGTGQFTMSSDAPLNTSGGRDLFFLAGNVSSGANSGRNGVSSNQTKTVTAVDGYVTVAYRTLGETSPDIRDYHSMLNAGSTALPYEPYWQHSLRKLGTATETLTLPQIIYADGTNATVSLKGNTVQSGTPTPSNPVDVVGVGELETTGEHAGEYKIPISNGQQTTNIYLGSTQTVRQIKKLVLTGDENWSEGACSIGYRFHMPITSAMQSDTTVGVRSMCTHQVLTSTGNTYNTLGTYTISGASGLFMTLDGDTRLASWKSWLATQYAAGTPVTIWYVLATPETAAVNEPLMKIGTYADTLSNAANIPTTDGANTITVDTTVQPSEFTATWTGWHDASVQEWDGSQWNE